MARKKKGHRMNGVRKAVRKYGSAAGSALILAPAWVTLPTAFKSGSPQGILQTYMHDTFGVYIDTGQVDQNFLISTIIPRDAALIGAGLFLKWLAKRA